MPFQNEENGYDPIDEVNHDIQVAIEEEKENEQQDKLDEEEPTEEDIGEGLMEEAEIKDYDRFHAATMYAKPVNQKQKEMVRYLWKRLGIEGNEEEMQKMNGFAASQFIKDLIKTKRELG